MNETQIVGGTPASKVRKHRRLAVLTLATLAALSAPVNAATLYSINVDTDELVTIDSESGTVTTVGPIGHDMTAPSAVFHNGQLFALNDTVVGLPDSGIVELIRLNHLTGAMQSVVHVTLDGSDLLTTAADDLTSANGTLVASFRTNLGEWHESNMLGDLAITGELTNIDDYSGLGADFDSLAADSSGNFFSADIQGGSVNLYQVSRSPLSYDLLSTLPVQGLDLVFTESEFFGFDPGMSELHQIDPVTGGILATVSMDPSTGLRGLAYRPVDAAVPAVSQWGMLIMTLLVLTGGTLVYAQRRRVQA